ncbi:MAG: NAD(P)H-dependent oxidoreductase [Actinomycetota bacterium]
MKVLVVHAHPGPDSLSAALRDAAIVGLERAGHEVIRHDLVADGFVAAMSAEERVAYHDPHPPPEPIAARYAADVQEVEAMAFVFPTWWFGPPAVLKGWFDRVLVHGVGFDLDDGKLSSRLRHVRRVAGVTTTGSPGWVIRLSGDGGRRTVNRTLRLMCNPRCRTSWYALHGIEQRDRAECEAFVRRVEEGFAGW